MQMTIIFLLCQKRVYGALHIYFPVFKGTHLIGMITQPDRVGVGTAIAFYSFARGSILEHPGLGLVKETVQFSISRPDAGDRSDGKLDVFFVAVAASRMPYCNHRNCKDACYYESFHRSIVSCANASSYFG